MRISEKPTNWLLIKASCTSDYFTMSHCLVHVNHKILGVWQHRSELAQKMRKEDSEFAYNHYWEYEGQFIDVYGEEEYEHLDLADNEDWKWVELEDGEEFTLPEPELRLDGSETRVYSEGGIQFIATGKHDGTAEVSSESINVQQIKEAYEKMDS